MYRKFYEISGHGKSLELLKVLMHPSRVTDVQVCGHRSHLCCHVFFYFLDVVRGYHYCIVQNLGLFFKPLNVKKKSFHHEIQFTIGSI